MTSFGRLGPNGFCSHWSCRSSFKLSQPPLETTFPSKASWEDWMGHLVFSSSHNFQLLLMNQLPLKYIHLRKIINMVWETRQQQRDLGLSWAQLSCSGSSLQWIQASGLSCMGIKCSTTINQYFGQTHSSSQDLIQRLKEPSQVCPPPTWHLRGRWF